MERIVVQSVRTIGGNKVLQDQSPYGVTEKDLKELKSLNKINQALKELGSYVNEAEPADGYHNDKVVDNAYKLLQEVIYGINSKR